MGADGGSVPRRDELVKTKGVVQQTAEAAAEAERARWRLCALSKEPLCEPIVADDLGHLFNKDVLVRAMLAHTLPAEFSHIRTLRDLHAARFTRNPTSTETASGASASLFVCPVTRHEAGVGGARGRMVLIVPCGCCVAESALNELPSSTSTTVVAAAAPPALSMCIVCGAAMDLARGPIVLNGNRDDVAKAMARMAAMQKPKKKTTKKQQCTTDHDHERPATKRQKADDSAAAPTAPAPTPVAVPKGANEDVFRSLFHSQQASAERSEDLFLCRSGAGGVIK